MNTRCPSWCLGSHRPDSEHHSARTRVGDLVAELLRYPEDPRVYLSLLESTVGGPYLLVPLCDVPLVPAAALHLAASRGYRVGIPDTKESPCR